MKLIGRPEFDFGWGMMSATALIGGLLLAMLGLHPLASDEVFHPPAARDLADLEPVFVEAQGGGKFRVGGQIVSKEGDLVALLKGLVREGEPATVGMADDARFAEALAAVRACERAGFSPVTFRSGAGRD